MRCLLLSCLLLLTSWAFTQDYDFTKIDQLLHEVDSTGPGVIIGVVKDQQLLYTATKGMANLDYNIPLHLASNFRLSSTSKQFTAACILHLVDKGQLSLNDALSKFFPDFSPKLGAVTVQQLLNHTSGIRDYMTLLMIQGSRQMDFFNSFIGEDRDIMELLLRQEDLSFASGTQHSYSNTNYWLLGQIVKQVSNKSLGEYAQENIFGPLGMANSFYTEISGVVIPQRVSGYVSPCPECPRMEYRFQPVSVGDGGVVSSIQDLLLWEQEFHEHRVLSDQCWENMLTQGRLNTGEEISYAAGLIISTFNDQKVVKHSGQNPGFTSEILRFPDHQLSVIVLGNQNWYDARRYANEAAAIFFPAETDTPEVLDAAKPRAADLTPAELERFSGDYHFLETNEYRTVELNGSTLSYLRNNGPTSTLIPVSKNVLVFEDRPHIQLVFTFKEDGGKQIEWRDPTMGILHADTYQKASLAEVDKVAYASPYESSELNKTFEIRLAEGQLLLFMLEHQVPLEPTRKDEFMAMGMFTLKFMRDQAGEITGFRMDAPRAENIFFRKS
ncbi:MAG: serine hydrolase domain-containing protein [Bacteroidota bacterium]